MPAEPDLVTRAHEFCIQAHAGQTRRDGRPYHTHPVAVAQLLREQGVDDPEILAAAYLHDVLEDTDIGADELARQFGPAAAALVEELTNPDYPGRTFEEKHRTLAGHARHMSDPAKLIKLADRLHNVSEIALRPPEKQQRYAEVTANLLDALRPWPNAALPRRIQTAIAPYLEGADE